MNPQFVSSVCESVFSQTPKSIHRFSTGTGNYVFRVVLDTADFVFRCGTQSYDNTIRYLTALQELEIPVSQVVAHGRQDGLYYMIAAYIDGQELGDVYPSLSDTVKRTIAKEVIQIQDRVSKLPINSSGTWTQWVRSMLDRARTRITANGFFAPESVDRLVPITLELQSYFETFPRLPYLDDITTKNLLIHNGHVSGIIDVDWLECGDRLTFAALTNMALLNLEYDTDYVEYLLEYLHISPMQRRAFQFYSLMFCVDFMGERGTTFLGRTVPVDSTIIERLNRIYGQLWDQYKQC